jgi:stage III sporulation protein AD
VLILLEILQIVGFAIVTVTIIIVIKSQKPEIAIQVSIAAGIIIFLMAAAKLSAVIQFLKEFTEKANMDMVFFTTLLKIIGIAYIAEFGAEICRDAGESSTASKIELAGKVLIVVLAVPIITSILELIVGIMP